MGNFQSLYEFIDRAVKNRKYPQETARGLKVALKIFETEVNIEEKNSISKFKENIEQIYHNLSLKNKSATASSLATYKSRVLKLINDYGQYGIDPTQMTNWSIKTVARQKKPGVSAGNISPRNDVQGTLSDSSINFVFDFRGGIKLTIPRNQTTSNAIADGELKSVRLALTKFADDFMMSKETMDKKEGNDS